MKKNIILGALALAFTLGAGVWLSRSPEAVSLAALAQDSEAEVDTSLVPEMVLGDENAPVEVVEYASFTCPHCATFHATVFGQLKENYIDTGKIRFINREVYFDRFGLWAGMVARCAGDTKRYYGLVDLIFQKQQDWMGGGDPAAITNNLRTLGKTAGLSDDQLDACLNNEAMAKSMVAVFQENMERNPIEGTPAIFVDGEPVSSSYQAISEAIDAKLAAE